MPNRIPPLLEPYLRLPPEFSLTLISSVLGASANWLVFQCLAAFYDRTTKKPSPYDDGLGGSSDANTSEDVIVILVSFMRDWECWRSEAKRTISLDLRQLQQRGRLTFIDGLTQLFLPPSADEKLSGASSPRYAPSSSSPATAWRGPTQHAAIPAEPPQLTCLTSPTLAHFRTVLLATIGTLRSQNPSAKIVLILDAPHILLQTGSPSSPITSVDFLSTLLQVRSQVHSTLITVPADDAFLAPAAALDLQQTSAQPGTSGFMSLETETASFVVGLVHQSRCVMACRRLGTGWADDVSGVLRITGGAGRFGDEEEEGGEEASIEEGEWLYHIKPDGSVKVWVRGASA